MSDPDKCDFVKPKIFTLFKKEDLKWNNFCDEKNNSTCIYKINLDKGVLTTSCEKNTICKHENKLSERFNEKVSKNAGQKNFAEKIPSTEIIIIKRDTQEPVMLVKQNAKDDDGKSVCAVVDKDNKELRNNRKPAECLAQSGLFGKPKAGKIIKKDKERERDSQNPGQNKQGQKVEQLDINSSEINGEKCFANMKSECSNRLNKNCPLASRKGAPPNGNIRETFAPIILEEVVDGTINEAQSESNKLDRASLALHMLVSNGNEDAVASPHEFKELAECLVEGCTEELTKVDTTQRRVLFIKRQLETLGVRAFRTSNNVDTQIDSINADSILDKNIEIEGATTNSLPDENKLAESMLVQQENIIDASKATYLNVCIYAILLVSIILF